MSSAEKAKLLTEIAKKWPHVINYITDEGLLQAYNDGAGTLDTWEFEAMECDRVFKAFGLKCGDKFPQCPKCGSSQFLTNAYTIVNFSVPFVSAFRVIVLGFTAGVPLDTTKVRCIRCRTVLPEKGNNAEKLKT